MFIRFKIHQQFLDGKWIMAVIDLEQMEKLPEKKRESSGISIKPELNIFHCYADQNYWFSHYYFIQCDKEATHQDRIALIANIEKKFPSTDIVGRVAKTGLSLYELQDEFRLFCNLQLKALKQKIQDRKLAMVMPETKGSEKTIKQKKCCETVTNFFNSLLKNGVDWVSKCDSHQMVEAIKKNLGS